MLVGTAAWWSLLIINATVNALRFCRENTQGAHPQRVRTHVIGVVRGVKVQM